MAETRGFGIGRRNCLRSSANLTGVKALKAESDLALGDQIRRLLAKPPGERTHFLRKRVAFRASCL